MAATRSFWVCSCSRGCYGHASLSQIHHRFSFSLYLQANIFFCIYFHEVLLMHGMFLFSYAGHAWTSDYGCSDNEEEFHWLIKYENSYCCYFHKTIPNLFHQIFWFTCFCSIWISSWPKAFYSICISHVSSLLVWAWVCCLLMSYYYIPLWFI